MAYIGQSPSIGNFQVCDAISVVNGQAAYTMQVSSVNVVPETANHMIVSLNGVIQAPGSSYTVSGSTITFASNLVTGDVINFIHILGSVLDLGVPSDDTVTAAKISSNAVTGAKLNTDVISAQTALATAPADTDEFLVSDAGVLKRIDYSLIKGGGGLVLLSSTNVTGNVSSVDFTSGIDSTYDSYKLHVTDLRTSSDGVEVKIRYGNSSDGFFDNNYSRASLGRESDGATSTGSGNGGGNNGLYITNSNLGNASTESMGFEMTLVKPSTTDTHKIVYATAGYMDENNDAVVMLWGGVHRVGTAAVDRIQVITNSGSISRGRFTLFGVVNS